MQGRPKSIFRQGFRDQFCITGEEGLGAIMGKWWKDNEALRKDFEERALQQKEVICYCHAGMRVTNISVPAGGIW